MSPRSPAQRDWKIPPASAGRTNLAIRINKNTSTGVPVDALSYANKVVSRSHVVARLESRDPTALEEIYDRMAGRAFGLAYRVLGDSSSAEDVVQEAFIWIWDNPQKLDTTRDSIDGLLLTIVHRRSIDALRTRTRRENLLAPATDNGREQAALDLVDHVHRTLEAEAINHAIKELPPEQLKVIEMAYFGGMTHAEISERTSLPLGTVKSRLRLALGGLRKSFGLGVSS